MIATSTVLPRHREVGDLYKGQEEGQRRRANKDLHRAYPMGLGDAPFGKSLIKNGSFIHVDGEVAAAALLWKVASQLTRV